MDLSQVRLIRNKRKYMVYDGDKLVNGGDDKVDERFYKNVYNKIIEKGYEPVTHGQATVFVPACRD